MTDPRHSTVRVDTTTSATPADAARVAEISGCSSSRLVGAGVRVRSRDSRVRDVVLTDFRAASPVRVGLDPRDTGQLRLYAIREGVWTLNQHDGPVPLAAGRFLAHRVAGLSGFATAAHTAAASVAVPVDAVGGLVRDAPMSGPAATPEMRLLVAYASLLHDTVGELTDGGADAARDALIELARGVVHRYADGAEPAFRPALAEAARALAVRRLADAELGPGLLARELHVSVRTLGRAFAAGGESPAAFIRRRRLEEARRALERGHTVSEVAARWHFADSSHLIRLFRRSFGETPAGYARSSKEKPAGDSKEKPAGDSKGKPAGDSKQE